ncbi:hypothetical protein [Novosphingobium sp. PC22D]|nr:hypothetical protein [Novosphingobium sp. PC22D]
MDDTRYEPDQAEDLGAASLETLGLPGETDEFGAIARLNGIEAE